MGAHNCVKKSEIFQNMMCYTQDEYCGLYRIWKGTLGVSVKTYFTMLREKIIHFGY